MKTNTTTHTQTTPVSLGPLLGIRCFWNLCRLHCLPKEKFGVFMILSIHTHTSVWKAKSKDWAHSDLTLMQVSRIWKNKLFNWIQPKEYWDFLISPFTGETLFLAYEGHKSIYTLHIRHSLSPWIMSPICGGRMFPKSLRFTSKRYVVGDSGACSEWMCQAVCPTDCLAAKWAPSEEDRMAWAGSFRQSLKRSAS